MFKLVKMFEMQKTVDDKILEKIGGRFDYMETKKVLALLTEIGEMTNEIRSIKFWSEDQTMRRDKTLEELADCLHFAVSIGMDIEVEPKFMDSAMGVADKEHRAELESQLKELGRDVLVDVKTADAYYNTAAFFNPGVDSTDVWIGVMAALKGLAIVLEFTEEEVAAAYEAKHKVNLERQATGY